VFEAAGFGIVVPTQHPARVQFSLTAYNHSSNRSFTGAIWLALVWLLLEYDMRYPRSRTHILVLGDCVTAAYVDDTAPFQKIPKM
jgi:hypothetical protein